MKVNLNDRDITLPEQKFNLRQFLAQQQITGKCFAVAVNGQFVPRSQYDQFDINGGAKIDIVMPMQGG